MKAPMCVALATVVVLFVLIGSKAVAQTGQMFGEITGKVVDAQGGVLPGVTVTLAGQSLMGTQVATTNEQGVYRFPGVPSGTYALKVELVGFSTYLQEGLIVPVRTTVTVDVNLRVASLQETVTVTGVSPMVDVTNTKLGERLDQEILTAIPTSRSIFSAASSLAGVVMGTQDVGGLRAATSTGMVAHGNAEYNLNYFGVTANTPQDYGSMYYMDYGSAEEISVDTAAMGAEIGGGGGANINIVPKSGGNRIKGSVYFTGTHKDLAWDNVDDGLRAQGVDRGTALLRLYDPNADAGGPIKRDRIWWYGSIRDFTTYENVIGFPKEFGSRLRNYSLRLTYQLARNNTLSTFWTHNTKQQPNRAAGTTRPAPETTHYQESPKNLENVNFTSVISQNNFIEVSSSMFRMYWPTRYSAEWYALPAPAPSVQDLGTGIFSGAHADGERFRDSYRLQLNAALTHYRDGWLGGSHQIRAGYEIWHGWGDERHVYFGDTRFRVRNGVPVEVFLYNTPLTQETHMRSTAAFVQDRMSYSRITVNLGLRYSFYDGWLPEQEGGGRWVPRTVYPRIDAPFDWSNLAPRTGITVKLTETGRDVAKLSYSRYYEHMYTWHFAEVINPNIIRTTGVATHRWFGDSNGNGTLDAGEFDPIPSNVFSPRRNSIDPDWKQPKTDEFTAGYQRQMARNTAVGVNWIQRWYTDNWADVNVGIPLDAYREVTTNDSGPDNLVGTADDRPFVWFDLLPAFRGQDAFRRQTVAGTMKYRGLEFVVNKRMADRWQLMASYTWSRLDGVILSTDSARQAQDINDPNAMRDSHNFGRGAFDQPHAFKLLGSYDAPYGINIGVNYQALSGLPRNREIRNTALAQGSVTVRAERRGTYREDTLSLLSIRANKVFPVGNRARVSGFAELHNALNSNAAQDFDVLTQAFASQAVFDARRSTTAYFGRVAQILAPRIAKFGVKLEF